MTTLSSLGGGGIKSIQEGFTSDSNTPTGTETLDGEVLNYLDITISAVNVDKSLATFVGGGAPTAADSYKRAGSALSTDAYPTLTSSTNLRIYADNAAGAISGWWRVVEYY